MIKCRNKGCTGYIAPYINNEEFGECIDCHATYLRENKEYKKGTKLEFIIKFRQALIKQQESNFKGV